MKRELILAFDASVVNEMYKEGMNDYDDSQEGSLNNAVMIQPRFVAESSTITRHPIPYTVLMDKGGDSIFLYRRGAKVGESRLSGNASCGIGGHVDIDGGLLDDSTSYETGEFYAIDTIYETVEKEIEEETGKMLGNSPTSLVGILRDDSNEVGKVHLGFIFVKSIDQDDVTKMAEDELETIGWVKLQSIDTNCPDLNLENWSKIVIEHLQATEETK